MTSLPQRRNPRRFVGESYRDCVDRLAGELSATEKDRDALQARVENLEAANAAVEEENDLLRDVIQQKHARVEVLTAALTEITNAVVDWNGDPGPAHVMVMDAAAARARAALAAGTTESEGT